MRRISFRPRRDDLRRVDDGGVGDQEGLASLGMTVVSAR